MATNSNETEFFPLNAAMPLCKTLFGFMPEEEDFRDMSRLLLRQTRGLQVRSRVGLNVPVVDGKVEMPCNAQVSGVTMASGYRASPMPASALVGTPDHLATYTLKGTEASNYVSVEDLALLNDPRSGYKKGAYVDFEFVDGQLEIKARASHVDVHFDQIMVSPDGYYMVGEKIIEALAYFLNHIKVQQDYFMGKVGREMHQEALARYETKVAQARVSRISDNLMNELLNISVSMDRHSYNK